jgi:hypothetical protein
MRRRAIRILVFLLLGAIVNVAVAWGLAMQTHSPGYDSAIERYESGRWQVRIQRHPGSLRRTFMSNIDEWMWLEPSSHERQAATAVDPPRYTQFAGVSLRSNGVQDPFEQINGWPQWSMRGFGVIIYDVNGRNLITGTEGGGLMFVKAPEQASSASYRIGGILPLLPIWPGFAINTVFYAAVLWMLFVAPFALRRWRRIRRGLCPKCGYDLRGAATDSAACPECGSAVAAPTIKNSGADAS